MEIAANNKLLVRAKQIKPAHKRKKSDVKKITSTESRRTLAGLVTTLQSFPPDFFAEGRVDLPPQERDFSLWDTPVEDAQETAVRVDSKIKKSIKNPLTQK